MRRKAIRAYVPQALKNVEHLIAAETETLLAQDRLADLFRKLDADIRTVPGGYVGSIGQSACYIDLMEGFPEKTRA